MWIADDVILKRLIFLTIILGLGFTAWWVSGLNTQHFDRQELTLDELVAIESNQHDPNLLLPDLVLLPAKELKVSTEVEGQIRLLFSTTYFNTGRGALELRADPATKGIRADIERDVLQRIYLADGGYRDRVVGHFLWHQEHLHYHYQDFITYDLVSLDEPGREDLSGILQKSTFCVRDISRVLAEIPGKKEEATYKICGKELQGISVGWGDTYYYDYPSQALNITDLPSGTYKLTFMANPARRLEELSYSNNGSSVTFEYDKEKVSVEVIEEKPTGLPEVEYVHLDDPFGM